MLMDDSLGFHDSNGFAFHCFRDSSSSGFLDSSSSGFHDFYPEKPQSISQPLNDSPDE
jgi:hypothetical protein